MTLLLSERQFFIDVEAPRLRTGRFVVGGEWGPRRSGFALAPPRIAILY